MQRIAKKEDFYKIFEIPEFIKFLVKKGVLFDLYKEYGQIGSNMRFVAYSVGGYGEGSHIMLDVEPPLSWTRANSYFPDPADVPKRFRVIDEINARNEVVEFDDLMNALRELFTRAGQAKHGEGEWANPDDMLVGFYIASMDDLHG